MIVKWECDGGARLVCGVNVRVFFFQAEDGIRDLVRSRGLGDVYKRQIIGRAFHHCGNSGLRRGIGERVTPAGNDDGQPFHLSLIHI